jgi:hypothetical protein
MLYQKGILLNSWNKTNIDSVRKIPLRSRSAHGLDLVRDRYDRLHDNGPWIQNTFWLLIKTLVIVEFISSVNTVKFCA